MTENTNGPRKVTFAIECILAEINKQIAELDGDFESENAVLHAAVCHCESLIEGLLDDGGEVAG